MQVMRLADLDDRLFTCSTAILSAYPQSPTARHLAHENKRKIVITEAAKVYFLNTALEKFFKVISRGRKPEIRQLNKHQYANTDSATVLIGIFIILLKNFMLLADKLF
ncbi:MAG: hypothetical protein A2096_07595 [Spirochaetes bacterium GWF1_41_5]|nr:MAG: hypothetical protein A2096_07595 [Spirochaetes bacterium GWF1_41_5]